MAVLGADPEDLEALAKLLRESAKRLRAALDAIDRRVRAVYWRGPNADAFRRLWPARRLLVTVAAEAMEVVGGRVQAEADAQRATSNGSTTGVGFAGHGRPGGRTPAEIAVDRYQQQAFHEAGIDRGSWKPGAGMDGNRATIQKVYEYYADLYREHPHMKWAGMASMMGPSFFAGFTDVDRAADVARLVRAIASNDVALSGLPTHLRASVERLAAMEDGEIEAELRWFERRFLSMQKEIFLDQATQHEAYRTDGMDGIRALFVAGEIDEKTMGAWEKIDTGRRTGDQALIDAGNEALLRREQHDIIEDDYARMYDRPVGPALTYAMTILGQPSIPGAQPYADVDPLVISLSGPERVGISTPSSIGPVRVPSVGVSVDNPAHGAVGVVTPLPGGNVAKFDDRWLLISRDTLPAYMAMSRDEVLAELAKPFDQRMQGLHAIERIEPVLAELALGWGVDVGPVRVERDVD